MGHLRNGPPSSLVLAIQDQLGLEDFIETGTHRGDTAAWASDHFSRVTTIELSQEFHRRAESRLQARPNIRCLSGDSPTVLSEIVPHLSRPAMFWLDAHWSGADTAGSAEQCPVLRELAIIAKSPIEHVVLVDDARLFCAPPPAPQHPDKWPSLSTIIEALEPRRRFIVLHEDVFLAVPLGARAFLNSSLQSAFENSRTRKRLLRWLRK